MSEETDILSQLDTMNLSDQETGMPTLRAGQIKVRVKKIEIVPNSKKDGNLVKIQLETLDPWESTKSTPVNPGFPLFGQISLRPTEKYPQSNIMKALAEFMECFLGSKDGTFMPLDKYIGQEGVVVVKPESTAEYGDQTRLVRYIKKG